jgi:hypothetical protein
MVLLIIVILFVAIFCFVHKLIIIGIISLLGFSKQFGWVALTITSLSLFVKGFWYIAIIPLLLIIWNLIGLKEV